MPVIAGRPTCLATLDAGLPAAVADSATDLEALA
jgi:hypothetical protein